MTILSTDIQAAMIVVDDIDDVTGPQNVPASGYKYGWRASVQSADVAIAQRTFVVVPTSTGTHTWQEQLTSAAGGDPDQKFTVASAAYQLNSPGTNTWLNPETGIAAAQAGTGTALGPAAGNSQRFVWVHPDLYTSTGAPVTLYPNVHVIGCADGAEAAIFDQYDFSYSGTGDIVIDGIYFTNTTFNVTGEGRIVFRNCRFGGCSLTHASNDQVEYVFDNCRGDIPTWVVSATGLASFNIVGSQQTGLGTFATPLVMATTTIAMTADNATVELTVTGAVVFDYSDAVLCAISAGSTLQLTVDGGKITSAGAKANLVSLLAASQFGLTCRGNATLPQTADLASTSPGSVVTVDLDQFQSEGNTVAAYYPTSITGPGSLLNSSTSGSRPRGFTGSQSVICLPGGALATQTIDVLYGAYDRIFLVPNYASAVLNPDTAAVNFMFASALLVDPAKMPVGHAIEISNARTTALNQANQVGGPIALRLPNGTTSQIGFMASTVAAHPIFSTDNYVILEPGQSCVLTVAQDPVSGIYRYLVSGIGSSVPGLTALEADYGPITSDQWYTTAKEAWTLLGAMPGTNGGDTTSGYPFRTQRSLLCSGAKFYWASAVPTTVRVKLWSSVGAPLATVDVPVAGIGDYVGVFANAFNLAADTTYWITIYDTSATLYMAGVSGGSTARFLVGPQPLRGYIRLLSLCTAVGLGDALPTTYQAEAPMLLVPTFLGI